MRSISIIGSGFSSLSAACYLASANYKVSVFEKNNYLGGRARQLKINGFTFDMGPTFYWMPDVFDSFFKDFNKRTSDYYQLDKLNPAYKVYFEKNATIIIGDNKKSILKTFEEIEKGSAKKLESFLKKAESNYNLAIKDLVYQPGESLFEIVNAKTVLKLNLFIKTIKTNVEKVVKHPHLRKILEFPVLFLGAKPSNTPSFYNFMNYADFVLVTWLTHKYVMHGFLWYLHADHHQPKYQGNFEKNDAFFIIFAIPSILLFYVGLEPILNYKFFIGLGISLYGIAYFLVHDVLIHQRFKWLKKTNNNYLKGLRKAHKVHHKHLGKENGECFGMLNVPKQYFKKYHK